MQCVFQGAINDTQKLSDGVNGSSSKITLGTNNPRTSLEEFKIFPQDYRSRQDRCTAVTFLTREPDGHWRIVTLPLQCPEHKNPVQCGALVNVDGVHLVSPQFIKSGEIDQFQVLEGLPPDVTYSNLSSRIFPGLNGQLQSRNNALTDSMTVSEKNCSKSSFVNLFTQMDSPILKPHNSGSTHLPDVFIESFKLDDTVRKNSKKKTRKKGKHNKKFPGFLELKVSREYGNGNLASEICFQNDGCRTVSCASPQELLSPDKRVDRNSLEVNHFGLSNCSDGILSEGPELSDCDGVDSPHHDERYPQDISRIHNLMMLDSISVSSNNDAQISCYDDLHLNSVSAMHNSLMLDPVSVSSDNDGSTDASHDVQSLTHMGSRIFISEALKACLSHGNLLDDVVDGCDHAERSKFSQGPSSGDMQSAVPSRRGKQSKMVSRSSHVHRVGNSHGHTGKENNHSVWQIVQRKDVDGCNKQVKKDTNLNGASLLKRNSNADQVNMLSKTIDNKQLKEKTCKKSKRKGSQASKQEVYPGNKSLAKVCSPVSIILQNEILDVSPQLDQKGMTSVSRSYSQIDYQKIGLHGNNVECLNTESVHSQTVCSDEVEPSAGVCKNLSEDIGNPDILVINSSESLGQSVPQQVRVPLHSPHLLVNEVDQMQKETSLSETSNQNHNSVLVPQKWVPVGLKNSGMTIFSRSNNFASENGDEPTAERWIMKHILLEKDASPKNVGVGCMVQSYENGDCSSHNQEIEIQNSGQSAYKIKEESNNFSVPNCSSFVSGDRKFNMIGTDSSKLVEAVNDACRVQLASEAVEAATGCPIAEFERLLHFTSPVVCELRKVSSCQTCQKDEINDALLCRHETPNIPLGCLWKWYEIHGSYGLEVKAEDYKNMKELGDDKSAFRAYFVPLLSAIQLFSYSKSPPEINERPFLDVGALEAPLGDRASDTCIDVGHLPIFSLLLPQPRTNHKSSSPEDCSEILSASTQGGVSFQSDDTSCSNDPELLFEYFESEQPQQRQPLYEKITELVRGNRSLQCKVYGDPTILNSINLRDLHPSSWYSVAWYPIYRIPDGKFRAAFLMYHSLGHLAWRRPKVDSCGADVSIISPVVGLESYNAQGECWFQSASVDRCVILKERLRTLEETASVMARAVVKRGDMECMNKHPDYGFFVSRRRC